MFTTLIVQPIFNLLAILYAFVHDFGLAVILLTLIIRLILWPLVTRQLHSQKALQELQPEMQRIRSEAKGDRQKEGQMIMELYKEREINPFASFLPLLIQLPVFFALYTVLSKIIKPGQIETLAYHFVKHLAPIADIIQHHGAFTPMLLGLINLSKPSPVLAVLAGVAQFIQTKQITPKQQPADNPAAQVTANMVYFFPVITVVIGLTLPSALALYWLVTSLVAVLQQYLVLHRDVEELEAEPTQLGSPNDKPRSKTKSKGGRS